MVVKVMLHAKGSSMHCSCTHYDSNVFIPMSVYTNQVTSKAVPKLNAWAGFITVM
jgi:hypothetical protein